MHLLNSDSRSLLHLVQLRLKHSGTTSREVLVYFTLVPLRCIGSRAPARASVMCAVDLNPTPSPEQRSRV